MMNINFSQLSSEDFEFLVEALLREKKFTIRSRPARGPDRGKDLIATRQWTDDMGIVNRERWLVECKHFSSSGKSVQESDLGNFESRMRVHEANRYLIATSTVLSQVAQDQIRAFSDDRSSERKATEWVRTDLERLLREYPSVWERFFFSWQVEATEAAEYVKDHHFEAHRGAILWCPGVTAVFGNDGYDASESIVTKKSASKTVSAFVAKRREESRRASKDSKEEVIQLRELLRIEQITELAFATSADGYTWCILAISDDSRYLNSLVWNCYPKGSSNNPYQQTIAFQRLQSYWRSPHKTNCLATVAQEKQKVQTKGLRDKPGNSKSFNLTKRRQGTKSTTPTKN